jgi:hypothetical protein
LWKILLRILRCFSVLVHSCDEILHHTSWIYNRGKIFSLDELVVRF